MAAATAGSASRSERRLGSVEQFWFMAGNSGQPQSASSGIGRVRLRQRAATPRSAAWRRCACRTPIDAAATIPSSTNPAAPRNPAWKPIGSAWLMGDEREFGGARACIHHPSAEACATAIAAGHALAGGAAAAGQPARDEPLPLDRVRCDAGRRRRRFLPDWCSSRCRWTSSGSSALPVCRDEPARPSSHSLARSSSAPSSSSPTSAASASTSACWWPARSTGAFRSHLGRWPRGGSRGS